MGDNLNARAWNDYEPCSKTVSTWCLELYEKIARCPCIARHTIITNSFFFSTPTPIKDSVGDDGGEEACSAGCAADGAVIFDLL